MALSYTGGGGVGATGGSNVTSISIPQPTLSATQTFFFGVTVNATGGAVDTPSGCTLVGNQALTTSSGGVSTSSSLYVFRKAGSAASSTITVTISGAVAGRLSAAYVVVNGSDTSGPVESSSFGDYLTAPSVSAIGATGLLTFHAVREGTSAGGFTIGVPSGMTQDGEEISVLSNGTTQVATQVAHVAVTTGSTGSKVATTTANTGYIAAAASVLLVAGSTSTTAPNAPVITATPGSAQVTINWTAPFDGGSAITGYTLQRSTTSGSGFATINSPASGATSYTDTGRTNGTTYYYKLSATNAVGTSSYSVEASATPTAASSTGYLAVVQATNPAHYYPLNATYTTTDVGNATPLVNWITDPGSGVTGPPTFDSTTVNGTSIDSARYAIGKSLTLASNSQDFSVTKTKELTIMMHVTVDNYDTGVSNGEYGHPLHKGESGLHEWMLRIYNTTGGPQNRPRRHSAYYFNPSGGIGDGSYCQPDMAPAVTAERNMIGKVGTTGGVAETNLGIEHVLIAQFYTTGTGTAPGGIRIFFNGVQIDADSMTSGNTIIPTFTTQKVRLGRQDFHNCWFVGRVRRVGFWNRLLTQTEITSLTSSTNRALSEGAPGSSGPPATAPTQPLNVAAERSSSTAAAATVSWTPPNSDGGASLTGYVVTHDNGGVGSPIVSSLLSSATRTYDLSGLPNLPINVSVIARNSVGDSSPGSTVIPSATILQPIGGMHDTFNGGVDGNRVFDTGVAQQNGEIEWLIVDTSHRGTYVRGDMRSQAASFSLAPSDKLNYATAFYVRSTATPTLQARIAVLNGTITARYDNGSADASSVTRVYSPSNDRFWRIISDGTNVAMQTSSDGTNYVSIGRALFTEPSWFSDVRVGVEAYTSTSI